MLAIGLVSAHEFDMPLTQEVLADTLGLTSFTSTALKRLREEGLISIQHKR